MATVNFLNTPPDIFPTTYWHKLEDGRIQCDLCPRGCKLQEGQQGLCFVRARKNNAIVLTTYGRSSGFYIDPIEKKPLYHFLPGTSILSFGTAGCNLMCKFCQNWDISKSREMDILADVAMPETIAAAAKYYGCKSVSFTYNDPVIFMEYAIDIAKECRQKDIKTVAVTAGYICPEPLKEFSQYMDAIKVDLKGFTEQFYAKVVGGHLKPILDNLIYIKYHTKCWLEIVTLLILGENDSDQEIHHMTKWIAKELGVDIPLHFTAFFPTWKMNNKPPTPVKSLIRARTIAIQNGLHYVYTGNVRDPEGNRSYCHQCHRYLIDRHDYDITLYTLTEKGSCSFCQASCPGIFEKSPGHWGSKRQPIVLRNYSGKTDGEG